MRLRSLLALAVIALCPRLAAAGEFDCPRPELWDRYPMVKQQVAQGLADLPRVLTAFEPEAFAARHPELARMARSADWPQRVRAIIAVAALEDPAGIPLLVAAIADARDKDEPTLNEALSPLTMWIATRAPRDRFQPLAPLFLDILVTARDWPSVRCRCLQVLGNLAHCDWLPMIRDLLVSRHPAVTNMSAWVIQQVSSRPGATVGAAGACPPAIVPTTQSDAIRALAEILAGTADPRVKAAAALGVLGAEHKSAVPHLLRAMNDPHPPVRAAAAQALDHIRWQLRQGRPDLSGDQVWPSDSEFVPPLVGLLADQDDAVRHVAMFCLIRIGRPARAAMPHLVGLYWFGTTQDRADALSALGAIDADDPASVAVFLDAARSSDVSMRVSAAGAMSHVKVDPAGRGIVQALAKALGDEAWNVRVQAAYGLQLIGPAAKAAMPALRAATDDPDERVRQHAARALETIQPESREITPDVPDAIDLTLPLDAAAYRPTDEELAGIVEKIKRLIGSPPEDRDGDRIFYSDGIGWHDGWIPMSPSLRDKPPDINHVLTWRYRHGRVVSVTVSEPGKRPWVEQRVWHNSQGAPVLSFRYYPADQPYYFQWGDYDRDGLLRRVIQLKADDFSLMSVQVHDNGPKYCRTVIRDFDAQGRLRGITRYADNKLTHTDVAHDEPPRFCGTTHRTTGLCLPEDWGLAPFYPIPPGPMQAAPGDPPGSMLRIASIRVHPAAVEEQCRAEVVIDNGGVGYQTPPGVVCDDIVIRIYDARGELIFRAGHGWMGMQAGQLTLNTDTHSNTLRAAGGRVFLFPKPGRYTLSITARRNDRGTWTDSRSVTFHVGMDRSEFRVLD